MADPRYDLTAARAVPLVGGGFADVVWNAVFVDSTGREFRHGKGYSMMRGADGDEATRAEMSAKLAAARTDADVMALVHADAARALAEIEARVGSEEPPAVVLIIPNVTVDPEDDSLDSRRFNPPLIGNEP